MKFALITGINGQDGSYLSELLLEKNYEVRTVFRILIQLYVSIKMKENESKSKDRKSVV